MHIVADQVSESSPQAHHRTSIEAKHQNCLWSDPFNPEQKSHSMDDNPCLSSPGPGQDEYVLLCFCGNDLLLTAIFQIINEADI